MRSFLALMLSLSTLLVSAADCTSVAQQLDRQLGGKRLNTRELAATLSHLNQQGKLPGHYVTKREARELGWQPGRPLPAGKHIGGDRFRNFERRLPQGDWREADLDYRGGKRNAKRLVFEPSKDGRRYVTIDHYERFTEVPACR
ncbi:ribonuclease domain-containing protein [Chitinimonas sp. BJYL2]|uniref:ribonuclease domain-containing protein n=1 Tax=Chitinimonas sp. BJYL2 TaxID=2976696 RepID=UPI0022B3A830|nr:ribonuclease domain-containing protein [Chitinimonas sp. BJYL2]